MKKLIAVAGLVCMPLWAQAQGLGDYIKATLTDHVVATTLYGFSGNDQGPVKLALVDSVFRIGRLDGASIVDLQAGFFGNSNEVEGENQVGNWIAGGQLRVDPFIKKYVPLPAHYEFLKAIVHGPVAYWDFTNKEEFFGYGVGLSFDLNPKVE